MADAVTSGRNRQSTQGIYLIDHTSAAVKNVSRFLSTFRYFVYASSNGHSPGGVVCYRFCGVEQREACAKVLAECAAPIVDRGFSRALRSDFHRRSIGRTDGLDGRDDPHR